MTDFGTTLAAMGGDRVRIVYGTAYWDGAEWWAEVGGNLIMARWLDSIQPVQRGNIVVAVIADERGLSTALVLGGYSTQPRPSTGTVLTVGISQIVFTGEDATVYSTERFIGTYSIGDPIYIEWDADVPTIIGKIPAVKITKPTNRPAPVGDGIVSGTLRTPATQSDTFGSGGWGKWSPDDEGRENVYSGTWNGSTVTGAWFYGVANTILAGRQIQQARFRLPRRLDTGSGGTDTVHLYAHTASNRPGGDVAIAAGPFDVSVGESSPAQWVVLPSNFHATLRAGGGISIAGSPYVGFLGRLKDPDSGKLEIDWTT